jgi:hypothetical protein
VYKSKAFKFPLSGFLTFPCALQTRKSQQYIASFLT